MQPLVTSLATVWAAALVLPACHQQGAVAGGEARSATCYEAHVGKAKAAAEKRMAFEASTFNAMAPSKQKEWLDTAGGISCGNGRRVAMAATIKANQQRARDAAIQYQ